MDEEDHLLVELWARCRGGEVTGAIAGMAAGAINSGPIGGLLPEGGGVLDQAACTMESLAIIESVHQIVRAKKNAG